MEIVSEFSGRHKIGSGVKSFNVRKGAVSTWIFPCRTRTTLQFSLSAAPTRLKWGAATWRSSARSNNNPTDFVTKAISSLKVSPFSQLQRVSTLKDEPDFNESRDYSNHVTPVSRDVQSINDQLILKCKTQKSHRGDLSTTQVPPVGLVIFNSIKRRVKLCFGLAVHWQMTGIL